MILKFKNLAKILIQTRRGDFSHHEKKFWIKIDIRGPDDCWLWTKGTNGIYGLCWDWRVKRNRPAHVIAWELYHKMSIGTRLGLHRCDNPPCCNPKHVFRGTYKRNMEDMQKKGRDNYTGYSRKVSHKDFLKMKKKYPNLTQEQLGIRLGVHTETIRRYINATN